VVLVRDVDQLPSVGPGAGLADVIASRVLPVVRLSEIIRKAGQSWIVRAAHAVHQGELIVNQSAAKALTRAFGRLFAARYPIRQMRPADAFGGSDERSMLADNTSAFNCRRVRGTPAWSQHAYGLAVDINPFQNPEALSDGAVDPPAAAAWANRSRHSRAMIRHGDAVWRAFISAGWHWGGDWASPKDYQHFSANGR